MAPAPYHHGPEIPYLYATALDWSCRQSRTSVDVCVCEWGRTRVAAHVQAETIPEAIRPGLTLRDALLNSSEFFGENAVYRACIAVKVIMKALKKRPIPVYKVSSQGIDKSGRVTNRRLTRHRYECEHSNMRRNLQTHRHHNQRPGAKLAHWQKT